MVDIIGRYVNVQGVRTYYEQAGEGQPIICVHTAGQDCLQWLYFLEYFSERGFRPIALDLPGHGKSFPKKWWEPIKSLKEYSDFIWEFARAIGVSNAIFAGCSIGGAIVFQLALDHQKGIKAIVSAEGGDYAPTYSVAYLEPWQSSTHIINYNEKTSYRQRYLAGTTTPQPLVDQLMWTAGRGRPEVHVCDLIGWAKHDIRDKVHEIQIPMLIIRGDEDYMVPPIEYYKRLQKKIKNSELIIMKGTGHYPMLTHHEQFNKAVETFLKKLTDKAV